MGCAQPCSQEILVVGAVGLDYLEGSGIEERCVSVEIQPRASRAIVVVVLPGSNTSKSAAGEEGGPT